MPDDTPRPDNACPDSAGPDSAGPDTGCPPTDCAATIHPDPAVWQFLVRRAQALHDGDIQACVEQILADAADAEHRPPDGPWSSLERDLAYRNRRTHSGITNGG